MALELYDEQTRFVAGERWAFIRVALRVDNPLGATAAGQRRFEFTPPYQHLVLHRLEVHRGNRVIDQLSRASVQVLRREVDLDNDVENGRRTAVIMLPDVRVGDVVYYEYSVIGSNPVLGGHAMDWWLLGRSVAVGAARYRVVSDHPLALRRFAGAPEPVSRRVGGLYEYSLLQKDVSAVQDDDNVPADYDVAPWIQFSDFQSWAEVDAWGRKLFHLPKQPSPAVEQAAREISGDAQTDQERVRRVIHAVEERVRYLSLAIAQSSHRPAPPEEVLARRYGDCKDKSLLATALLRALGIDAHVALVNPESRSRPASMLPTIMAFDHAIVVVVLDGVRYWLDPTRLYQRGTLSDMVVDDELYALELAPGEDALIHVAAGFRRKPDVSVEQRYTFATFGGPTKLEIKAIYRHDRAEYLRAAHADSAADFAKSLRAQVLEAHPHAKPLGKLQYTDHADTNEIEVVHRYELEGEWTRRKGGRETLIVVPVGFMRRILQAKPDRRLPLALEYPLWVEHDVSVDTPGGIGVNDSPINRSVGGFKFGFKPEKDGTILHLHYGVIDSGPRIAESQLRAYRALVERASSAASIALWKVDTTGAKRELGWIELGATAWTFAFLTLLFFYHRAQPWLRRPNVPYQPELAGRQGWLMLMGFGVTVAPLARAGYLLKYLAPHNAKAFALMMSPGSSAYHPGFGILVAYELWYLVTLFLVSSYVAYLYWTKRRSFPLTFALVAVLMIAVGTGDSVAAELILGRSRQAANLVVLTPFLLMWAAYALQSRRVKATFLPAPRSARGRARDAGPPDPITDDAEGALHDPAAQA